MAELFSQYNYIVVIILMMTGLYTIFASRNLIKKLVGLSVFQTSVFLLYITIGKVKNAVLSPNLEISPTLTKIPTPQTTDIGRVMFANSITLTPGTVSVDIQDDHILVHALLSEMSDPADFREMGERAAWAIGEEIGPETNREDK